MLQREEILSIGYLKKTTFSGSSEGMRFLLKKETKEEDTVLLVYAWPEPFSFDHTPSEQILSCEKAFTEDGIQDAVQWLNAVHDTICRDDP